MGWLKWWRNRPHTHSVTWDGYYEHCRTCGACAGDRRDPITGSRYVFFSDWPPV